MAHVINDPGLISKIEHMRILKERMAQHQAETRAMLYAGFTSPFWGVLKQELARTLDACRTELEKVTDTHRLALLQGEIAALRVLIDWGESIKRPTTNPTPGNG